MQSLSSIRAIIGAGATALVIALILGSFTTAGVIDMTMAWVLLATAWVVGIAAIFASEPFLGLKPKYRVLASVGAIVISGVVMLGIGLLEYIKRPADQTMPHARLEFSKISFEQLPGNPNRIPRLHFTNVGSIPATYVVIIGAILFVEGELSEELKDKNMKMLIDKARISTPLSDI